MSFLTNLGVVKVIGEKCVVCVRHMNMSKIMTLSLTKEELDGLKEWPIPAEDFDGKHYGILMPLRPFNGGYAVKLRILDKTPHIYRMTHDMLAKLSENAE